MSSNYINIIILEAYEGFVHGGESHSGDHSTSNTTTQVPHYVQKRETGKYCEQRTVPFKGFSPSEEIYFQDTVLHLSITKFRCSKNLLWEDHIWVNLNVVT